MLPEVSIASTTCSWEPASRVTVTARSSPSSCSENALAGTCSPARPGGSVTVARRSGAFVVSGGATESDVVSAATRRRQAEEEPGGERGGEQALHDGEPPARRTSSTAPKMEAGSSMPTSVSFSPNVGRSPVGTAPPRYRPFSSMPAA